MKEKSVMKKVIKVPSLTKDEYVAQFQEEVTLGEETIKTIEKLTPYEGVKTFRCFKKLVIYFRGKYYMRT